MRAVCGWRPPTLAVVLRVPTSALITGPDAPEPDHDSVQEWESVRRALAGSPADEEPAEEPTLAGVQGDPFVWSGTHGL